MKQMDIQAWTPNVYAAFGSQNALLTAGDKTKCNTMTIGWCQLGRVWGIPVCTVYVRPERYTYQFMEAHDYFTVSVLPDSQQKTMQLCGSKSGRDVDKIKACGLTLRYGPGDAPYFEEAEWVLVCKKLYVQDMQLDCILNQDHILPYYGKKGGLHRIYTGEVAAAYQQ
ncbi:MAG: flavin reductase [Oscillibacter sp.]